MTTESGDLGLTDLESPAPQLHLYSKYSAPGIAWAPNSRRLAFVEQFPGEAPQLWILDPETGREARPITDGHDWKGQPIWLDDYTVAYLSARGAEYLRVWKIHVIERKPELLLDRGTDITRLYGCSEGGPFAYQSRESGSAELWFVAGAESVPRRLTHDRRGYAPIEAPAALAPGGSRLVYATPGEQGGFELVWIDPAAPDEKQTLKLETLPASLVMPGAERLLAVAGPRLIEWRPPWGMLSDDLDESEWNGVPLGPVAGCGGEGLAVGLDGNIPLVLRKGLDLDDAQWQVRRPEDLIWLARQLAEAGELKQARNRLLDLWDDAQPGSRVRLPIAVALGEIERKRGKISRAQRWLERAIEEAGPESIEAEALWLERAALAAFEAGSASSSAELLATMPAGVRAQPLSEWIAQLNAPAVARPVAEGWREIGRWVRTGQSTHAVDTLYRIVALEGWTAPTLTGLQMTLEGEFEPLRRIQASEAYPAEPMLLDPGFIQLVLEAASRRELDGFSIDAVTNMLLFTWIEGGRLEAARSLVMLDLDGAAVAMDYPMELRAFLMAEETDRWQELAVTKVLLSEGPEAVLERDLTQPAERLWLRLAQAKAAIIDGDARPAMTAVDDAQTQLNRIGGGRLTRQDIVAARFWIELFHAKIFEQEGQWDAAIDSYRRSLLVMSLCPQNWDIAPFEVERMIELLGEGRADSDALVSYLRVMRGLGDPLVNPSHESDTVSAALENLNVLEQFLSEPWLKPHLAYARAMCLSVTGRNWEALYYLRAARGLNPHRALLQRILLEEAALRDSFDQHELAAGLLDGVLARAQSTSVRASAILARLQSRMGCGMVALAAADLEKTLEHEEMPPAWRDWLYWQVGQTAEARHNDFELSTIEELD